MAEQKQTLREQAARVAVELLIIHGYKGVSFGDIAKRIDTTRANLHYHFENKHSLVAEVLDDYTADASIRYRTIWLDEDSNLVEKVRHTFEFNRQRYQRFNSGEVQGRPWSLIARLRSDDEYLGADANARLRQFTSDLRTDLTRGIEMAIRKGELRKDAPVRSIMLLLASIINSAGPITQDSQNIEELGDLYAAFADTVLTAYGTPGARASFAGTVKTD